MRQSFRQRLHSAGKAARSFLLVLFALLLTAGAVTGRETLLANKTNTGAPGTTTVSSIKNFGGGNFQSDYQGAYFYILPYRDMTTSVDWIFEGTLFHTTKTKTAENGKSVPMTYRDLLGQDSGQPSWGNQYAFIKQQGYTAVPPQTSEALLFVPYTTHNGTTLQEGWKADISSICYYDENGGTVTESYKISTAEKNLKNRIFAPAISEKDFNRFCRDGVFYRLLAEWTAEQTAADLSGRVAGKDGKAVISEADIDIAVLRKKLGTKKAIRKVIADHPALQTEGYRLWCYILSLDQSGDTLTFGASDKITEFLEEGYNSAVSARNRKYNDNTGLGFGGTEYELREWTDHDVNSPVFSKNKFAQREYNLHTLDLMLCACAAAVKQGASDEVTDAWLEAICDYVNFSDCDSFDFNRNSSLTENRTVPIAICGGTIARGADQTRSGSTTNRIVYVGTQDLVNFAEQLENAGTKTGFTGSTMAKDNSRSVTKSCLGQRIGGSGSDRTFLMKLADPNGDALQPVNDEVFAYGTRAKKSELEESTVKTDAGSYTVTAIKV